MGDTLERMRIGSLLVLCVAVAGCATTVSPEGQAPVEAAPVPVPGRSLQPAAQLPVPGSAASLPPPGAAAPPRSSVIATPSNPAVLALLDQAKLQAQQGDGERAAATLERAIRIEPRDPWLWHRLAVLRLQQQRYRDAIDMANKSNALADDDKLLLSGNYQVIAQALAAAGDREGAERARARSQRYGGTPSSD